MSRRRSAVGAKKSRMAMPIALIAGVAALAGCALVVVLLVPGSGSTDTQRLWAFGMVASVIVGALVGVIVGVQVGRIASRVTDLSLAVAKIGRGGADVRVRVAGQDEVGQLGRAVQHLATDIGALVTEIDQGGGQAASRDPQSRAFRDLTLNEPFARAAGFEVDGALAAGSRGGLDYFGCVAPENGPCMVYTIGGEGSGPMAVVASRLARDELARALEAGRSARQALAHTNKRMHERLPRGVCARASVLEVQDGQPAKLYQAGDKSPLWICSAGQALELNADGLALGLDDGPVFEKSLRPESIDMRPGTRLVLSNDAGARTQELLDLVTEHAPKHTAPFMNLVLGALESDAGSEGLREDIVLVTVKKS